jgi:hypothetical protein
MTAGQTNPINWPRVRWFHWLVLALLLAAGTSIRWDRIDKQSLWIDEYWALYLATGRGDQLFQTPHNVILDPPPRIGIAGAPHWWHIWPGLGSVTHPPAYFLALRAWIEFFGDSDRAIRSLSTLFSLAGIMIIFSLVRRLRGPGAALVAAGLMAFAPMQIDYSQTTRPYTMLVFFSLLFCHALISIQLRGVRPRRLVLLGASVLAMALTHYFSAGAILGAIVYIFIRFTGKSRRMSLISIGIALLIAAILWGPFLWKIRGSFDAFPNFARAPANKIQSIARAVVTIPAQVLFEPEGPWNCLQALPLALLVYIAPLLLMRKSPEMLLWWLWIVGTIGMLLAVDFYRNTLLIGILRYSFILSPAIFIILATFLPQHWLGRSVSYAALLGAILYGLDRLEVGPDPNEDWQTLARITNRLAGPGDIIAFAGSYDYEPGFNYVVMAHYMPKWTCPIMFLTNEPSDAVLRQLAAHGRIWIIGHNPTSETGRYLPGWTTGDMHGGGAIGELIWAASPPATATEK